MPYRFEVFERFSDIPQSYRFDTGQSLPICPGIDTVERAEVAFLKHFYLAVHNEQGLLAMAYFQELLVTPAHFNLQHKPWQQMALKLVLPIIRPRMLVSGNLFRHDVVFQQFHPVLTLASQKAALYRHMIDFMISHTRATGIFLKDVPVELCEGLEKESAFTRLPEDIFMEMMIPSDWKQFTDYEKALKHKYLQRCRKIRKTFTPIRIAELDYSAMEQCRDQLEALYLQVARKQLLSMGMVNASFFLELKRALADRLVVYGYYLDDQMIAFSSAILHDDNYDMNYIGFDYRYNQTHHLYFNILFHCLEQALVRGCRKLILGRTAAEAKATMGCAADYRFSYYKLRNVVVNIFYQRISRYFREQQGESWKSRHPFKSQYYTQTTDL